MSDLAPLRNESALVRLNRDLAQALFGSRRGRPTISTRAGHAISAFVGVSPRAGKAAFHAGVAGIVGRSVARGGGTPVAAFVAGLATWTYLEGDDPW
jgi:hypothetical protein